MPQEQFDIAVIGGGVNGASIARDAAGRGYKVILVEQDDLASHTSSSSSKLIHGGLRYLEFFEFSLVREALNEREVLMNIAPHIIWPLRFVLPHHPDMRPSWMIRAGLWLYDHLGKRKTLPGSRGISLERHESGKPLKSKYNKAYAYSDCWVQDARLVVLNAMDAALHGATVLTRTRCESAVAQDSRWELDLTSRSGKVFNASARLLVNATGPWVTKFLDSRIKLPHDRNIRLVLGSHIVVPAIFDHGMAYIFQNDDGRIVFALPYEKHYTLIGTTERDVEKPCGDTITTEETEYLCRAANDYFNREISGEDVVWAYSGVRPLVSDNSEDATSTTREYQLDMQDSPAPCLSVFGGKITTCRSLAEHAMELIGKNLDDSRPAWTSTRPLPGGDFPDAGFAGYLEDFKAQRPWLPEETAWHYVRNYGTRAKDLCGDAGSLEELGRDFGQGLYQAEIDYLVDHEWVQETEDLLWRRSKWGLHLDENSRQVVVEYLQSIDGN